MFDLSKFFDLSKKYVLPATLLKSKNYCTTLQSIQSIKKTIQGIDDPGSFKM